jgi:hypothetical protein
MRSSRYWIAFGAAAMLAIAAGVGYAAIPDSQGVIHACYDRTKGDLRVTDTHNPRLGACVAGKETALDWNQQGPPGPAGPGQVGHGIREFTTSGTLTVPEGVTSVFVEALGAGGGGGGGGALFCQGGGGGGAGGYVRGVATIAPGRSFRITIGAGGAGGAAGDTTLPGGPGGPGGVTSFAPSHGVALIVAGGGAGGGGGNADTGPGMGGAGGHGDANGGVAIAGGDGRLGGCLDSGAGAHEGSVGARPPEVGDGGQGAFQNFEDGATSGFPGSPGKPGYMVVEW